MKRVQFSIGHPSQLSQLSVWRKAAGRRVGRVTIDDEKLGLETRQRWEAKLNRAYFACGCSKAALGLALGLVADVAWLLLRGGGWAALRWHDVPVGVIAIFSATLAGKLTGLWMAQRNLKQAASEIQAEWGITLSTKCRS